MEKLPKVLVVSSNMGSKESNLMVTQNNVEATFICYNDLNFPLRDKSMKPRLTSKIPRCMSWEMHPGYDYYVWLDFKFNITNPNAISWLINQMKDNKIAFFRHHMRDSIKDEYGFIKYNIENPHENGHEYLVERYSNEDMKTQMELYLSDKTFVDNNLFELACFIYHKSIVENKEYNVMKEFFHHICYYSVMDQLSFPYLLHKFNIKFSVIDQNVYHCPYLNQYKGKVDRMRDYQYTKGLKNLIEYLPKNITMIEIGSYMGESTKMFLDSNKFSKIYVVDPWETIYFPFDNKGRSDYALAEKIFDETIKDDSRVIKYKMTSTKASSILPKVDFIYIDGNHEYKEVLNDINISLKLVKPGGYIAGHDYSIEGVQKAVKETIGNIDHKFEDDSWIKRIK
jgi:cephalosporin hydroxylase